jgi:hypothetical protein
MSVAALHRAGHDGTDSSSTADQASEPLGDGGISARPGVPDSLLQLQQRHRGLVQVRSPDTQLLPRVQAARADLTCLVARAVGACLAAAQQGALEQAHGAAGAGAGAEAAGGEDQDARRRRVLAAGKRSGVVKAAKQVGAGWGRCLLSD